MTREAKTRVIQNSLWRFLQTETAFRNRSLSAWIARVDERKALDSLFDLETRLRGLLAFIGIRHLPLSDTERNDLLGRTFAAEIGIVRQSLVHCEGRATEILHLEQTDKPDFASVAETHLRAAHLEDYPAHRILEQMNARDSLAELVASLSDLRILIDSMHEPGNQTLQVFLSLGRTLKRHLQCCRYIDMLLSQRFVLQYDKIEDPHLGSLLHHIREENIRRDVSLALLHMFRFLKYLKIVSQDMTADLPLRPCLVIFALLHEKMLRFAEFLKINFFKDRTAGRSLRGAAELIYYSMKSEAQRVIDRELVFLARETDATVIYARIENSHGLLQNCCQSGIVTMVQAFQTEFDPKRLFPSMAESLQKSQRLRQDLWELRQYMKEVIELNMEMDTSRIVSRLASFRESSLPFLMYRDWGEFEQLTDSLIGAGNAREARVMLRHFIGFLETLVQEVSKRSILS